jgi:hypothetical protein
MPGEKIRQPSGGIANGPSQASDTVSRPPPEDRPRETERGARPDLKSECEENFGPFVWEERDQYVKNCHGELVLVREGFCQELLDQS